MNVLNKGLKIHNIYCYNKITYSITVANLQQALIFYNRRGEKKWWK
jgi:hypothetical protein